MILLVDATEDKIIGFISDDDEENTLENIRIKILNEHDGIENFHFLMFGEQILVSQEKSNKLKHITIDSNEEGFQKQILIEVTSHQIRKISSPSLKCSIPTTRSTPAGKSPCITKETPKGSPPQTQHNSKKSLSYSSSLVNSDVDDSDTNPLKLKPFSVTEIEMATGLFEKEKMEYHNRMLKKIERDFKMVGWGVWAQNGVVESAWTLRKSVLLQYEAERILKKIAETDTTGLNETDQSKLKKLEKKLLDGLENLNKSKFFVDQEYLSLRKELNKKGSNRLSLEEGFTLSNLKVMQANICKNLGAVEEFYQILDQKQKEDNGSKEYELREEDTALSEDDVESLMTQVRLESDELED